MRYNPETYARTWTGMKIVVTGAQGVGKTALVGAASDQPPSHTVETIATERGPAPLILDLGRIDVTDQHIVTLVGAPLPTAWDSLWQDVVRGAMGAVVLVHPEDPRACAPALEYLQQAGVPYQVVVAHFAGTTPDPVAVCEALEVDAGSVTVCDPRSRPGTRFAIGDLVQRLLRHNLIGEAS